MARTIKNKELTRTRLAANYGGWMYCTECNENIGYLCYATYDKLILHYECNCENHGSALIDFEDSKDGHNTDNELITIKNRLCCPEDSSPLITILNKKLKNYELEITCKDCSKTYKKEK